jgi:Ca-activated chloride channel family protein
MFLQGFSVPIRKPTTLLLLLLLFAVCVSAQNPMAEAPAAAGSPPSLSIGIVVDNSGSYRTIFDRVVTSTNTIIQDVRPGDEAFFVTFVDTPKIVLRQEMTRDKQELRDASDNMFIEGGQTALIDAVVSAARYMAENAAKDSDRVLILITDGDERGSSASVEEAVKTAKEAKVRIFVLGLYEEKFYAKVVDRLIKETGGAKFVPRIPKETAAAVTNVLAAIRSK